MGESEKATENYLRVKVQRASGMCFKFVSPGMRGVPDRICLFPGGILIFVEVKSEGEPLEPHQTRMHLYMKRRGALVYTVDTKAGVDKLVNFYSEVENVLKPNSSIARNP